MPRTQRKNRQKMWYSSPDGEVSKYNRDENGNIIYEHYYDADGEKVFILDDDGNKIPSDTGEKDVHYSMERDFRGTLSSQLENALMRAWGSDNTNNYAVLTIAKGSLNSDGEVIRLQNGTRIWRTSEIKRMDDGSPDGGSADYVVSGVLDEELNENSYYLTKLDGGDSIE